MRRITKQQCVYIAWFALAANRRYFFRPELEKVIEHYYKDLKKWLVFNHLEAQQKGAFELVKEHNGWNLISNGKELLDYRLTSSEFYYAMLAAKGLATFARF